MKKLNAEYVSIYWHKRQYRQAGCESRWRPPVTFQFLGKRNPEANRSKYVPDGIPARLNHARKRNGVSLADLTAIGKLE